MDHPYQRAAGPLLIGAGNVTAWLSDLNAGAVVSVATVIVVGFTGLYLYVTNKVAESRRQRYEAAQRLEMTLESDRLRARLAIQAEQDRANKDSLSAQLAAIQASLDAAKVDLEKARKNLHEQRNEWNAVNLQRQEDMQAMRSQLADTYDELHEARKQIKELSTDLKESRGENRALLARIDGMTLRVDANTDRIDHLAERSSASDDAIHALEVKADAPPLVTIPAEVVVVNTPARPVPVQPAADAGGAP